MMVLAAFIWARALLVVDTIDDVLYSSPLSSRQVRATACVCWVFND
jgi:hypothetical protein